MCVRFLEVVSGQGSMGERGWQFGKPERSLMRRPKTGVTAEVTRDMHLEVESTPLALRMPSLSASNPFFCSRVQ
jgi:hypothetical protein